MEVERDARSQQRAVTIPNYDLYQDERRNAYLVGLVIRTFPYSDQALRVITVLISIEITIEINFLKSNLLHTLF